MNPLQITNLAATLIPTAVQSVGNLLERSSEAFSQSFANLLDALPSEKSAEAAKAGQNQTPHNGQGTAGDDFASLYQKLSSRLKEFFGGQCDGQEISFTVQPNGRFQVETETGDAQLIESALNQSHELVDLADALLQAKQEKLWNSPSAGLTTARAFPLEFHGTDTPATLNSSSDQQVSLKIQF